MAVEQKVKQIIVEQLGVDESQVDSNASFVDDLGADSLDIVELVMAFEEAFELEIPDEDAEKIATVKDAVDYIEAKKIKKTGRFIQFAIAAADFALKYSGLQVTPEIEEEVGVYIGSGIGGFEVIEREHQTLLEHGPRRISPFFITATIVNLASGYVSIKSGAKGPNSATATACTTSAHSIGDSFRLIQHGDADAMICGGTEACITPMGVGGFAAMRALSTRNDEPQRASRPWDRDRDGFVVGEGAGILVIEELEHAKSRGATIYCEITGYGMSSDAYHITSPAEDGGGMIRVMRSALRDAQL